MRAVNVKTIVVGKDETKGLQTPRFRLHSGDENPNNIMVVHYGVIQRETPETEVTNVYKVIDILNEYIDDYHEKHKDD